MNRSSILALLSEFGPLLAFFIAGSLTSFFTAVAVLMVVTTLSVTLSWYADKRIPWLPIVSAVFVLVGGGITLIWQSPDAIIFADTLYYGFISLILAFSIWQQIPLFKKLFGTVFAMTDEGWRVLTLRWCIFLGLAALSNEVARAVLTPENWIEYRLYKSVIVSLFATYQLTLSTKYRLAEVSSRFGIRIK